MEHRSISAPPINYDGTNTNGSRSGLSALYGLSNDQTGDGRPNPSTLLNIIGSGGGGVGSGGGEVPAPSSLASLDHLVGERPHNNDSVEEMIRSRPRSLEDEKYNYFGLNLVRSQSAAPEIFSGASLRDSGATRLPPGYESVASKTSATTSLGDENAIFSRPRFFDEEEEDREALMQSATRRPASTGVIGRPNNENGSVNSILETLGLAPSTDYSSETTDEISAPYAKPLGGIGSSGSLMGHHSSGKKSIMDKIREGSPKTTPSNYFTNEEPSHIFPTQGSIPHGNSSDHLAAPGSQLGLPSNTGGRSHISSSQHNGRQFSPPEANAPNYLSSNYEPNNASSITRQSINLGREQQPNLIIPNQAVTSGGILHPHQLHQVHPQTQTHQLHQLHQQHPVPYESSASAYFHHQPHPHSQTDHRAQPNLNVLQNAPSAGQGQPTIYHINSPAAPFGFEYHTIQQPQPHPHGAPANHILLPHHPSGTPLGQPQYISIVPIQTSPVVGGPPNSAYAYVQYGGDGIPLRNPQAVVTGAPPAFVLGTHHIPLANASGALSANALHYNSGTSPPDARAPSRGAGGMTTKSPDRVHRNVGSGDGRGGGARGQNRRGGGAMSSPSGRRTDPSKNGSGGSKLGPVAGNLLNEIRAAKSRNQWTIHDINGHIVEFCLDQNGSRFIQQRLEVADANEKKAVMDEVLPAVTELQNDVFGNYVVQKLFEFGTDEMKSDLKGTLEGNMLSLSLQMYGCRVVQKALESLGYEDLCELLSEFHQNVLTCIQDQNGNHVMQKCIEVMSIKAKEAESLTGEVGLSYTMAERIQFIVDDVLANVETLCCHPYGCRVLQRMLEHCVEFQKKATLDEISLCHKTLLDDQYGNYVIQHVLQYGRESDRDSLLQIIVENDLLKLSRQKFASNVVEKLLKYGNASQRNAIVREMLKVVSEGGTSQEGVGSSVLLLMVRDAYANYVVQTAIDVVPEGNEKRLLLDELRANEVQLRNYTFAKHIVAKLGTK